MSDNSTQPFRWPPHGEICCTPQQAVAWLDCIAEMAVHGDDDAAVALGAAAQHWLDSLRQDGSQTRKPASKRGFLFSTPRAERGFLM